MWKCRKGAWRYTVLLVALGTINAHGSRDCIDVSEQDEYVIRRMGVEGLWAPTVDLPVGRYSQAKVSDALHRVQTAIAKQSNADEEFQNVGAISVLYVDSCIRPVDRAACMAVTGTPRCVDVAIRPHAIRFYLFKAGSNLVPVPRPVWLTWFPAVPGPLRALNPGFGIAYDREYGPSQSASISTNLFDLPAIASHEALDPNRSRLQLDIIERKSFSEPFYGVDARLALGRRHPEALMTDLAFDGALGANRQPLGDATYERYATRVGSRLEFGPGFETLRTLQVRGQYQWSRNRFIAPSGTNGTNEHAGQLQAVSDARLAGTFTRAAVWGNVASPTGLGQTYERAAAILGMQRDFVVRTNQTVGVELLLGGGRSWGNTPQYARFFGGNSARNFLYDTPTSPSLSDFPEGPLIRSFGEAQADVSTRSGARRGGTSYWNVNLNISLPIPPLSRPLIPDETVTSIGSRSVTLKDMLKSAVKGGKVTYASTLKKQGVPAEEALTTADAAWRTISPVIEFIADQANLYAVKPLALLDIAGIDATDSRNTGTRVAAGGGLQFTVVVAKFELGYLSTVVRQPGDQRGNAFFRLTFQNIF